MYISLYWHSNWSRINDYLFVSENRAMFRTILNKAAAARLICNCGRLQTTQMKPMLNKSGLLIATERYSLIVSSIDENIVNEFGTKSRFNSIQSIVATCITFSILKNGICNIALESHPTWFCIRLVISINIYSTCFKSIVY